MLQQVDPSPPRGRPRVIASLLVVLAFALPALVFILRDVNRGPQFSDQQAYHLPTVILFANEWPHLDFRTYPAAMTPGYHLLMAALVRGGGDLLALRLASWLITCAFLALLAWVVSARAGGGDTLRLCLPVAFSPYLFASGLYVAPHNLAWLGVLGLLLLALHFEPKSWKFALLAALLLATVLVRQIHLWVLAPVLVAAWMGGADARPLAINRGRLTRTAIALLCALPAILALAWFVKQWGGLAPKTQEWVHPVQEINLAAIVMILATIGALGLFYLGFIRGDARQKSGRWKWAMVGAAIACAIALIPLTTYDVDAGRWSGLWNMANLIRPTAGRSPVIIALATLGGAVIGTLLSGQAMRERLIYAAALIGFTAAHATINQAWQRYYEPLILLVLVLAAAGRMNGAGRVDGSMLGRSWWRSALLPLAFIQLALTLKSLS